MKTWFITGVSRGLGLALAQAALARGDTVVGTVRRDPPSFEGPGEAHLLTLDLADAAAIGPAVEQAFAAAGGRLDVVVNNAGYGLLGAMEDASDAEIERLYAVDVFAPARVIRAALPRLRVQGSGHIVNVTSIAGRAPLAGSAIYASAKFAIEGLSATLAQEVAPLGIKVTAVAPGAFRTDFFSDHSIRRSSGVADEAYAETVGKSGQAFAAMAGRQLGDPAKAAQAILELVDADDPPIQLLLGSDAVRRMEAKLEAMRTEITDWRETSVRTDFPSAG